MRSLRTKVSRTNALRATGPGHQRAVVAGAALFGLGLMASANAQVIDPTVADFSSQLTSDQCCDRDASFTVDGSGLDSSGTRHSNAATPNMWTTTGSNAFSPADGAPFITYDLGSSVNVTSAHVWNYNEDISATCCIGFGPKDVEISAGNDLSSLTDRGAVIFPEATGSNSYTGADVKMALNNVRFVRFDIKDTWGNSIFDGTTGVPNGDDPRGLTGLSEIRFNAVSTIPGDANMDGRVTFADLLILAQHYGKSPNETFGDGDFNNDGGVGFDDLLILAQNYGIGAAAVATAAPEPASLAAVLPAAIALLHRRRRR